MRRADETCSLDDHDECVNESRAPVLPPRGRPACRWDQRRALPRRRCSGSRSSSIVHNFGDADFVVLLRHSITGGRRVAGDYDITGSLRLSSCQRQLYEPLNEKPCSTTTSDAVLDSCLFNYAIGLLCTLPLQHAVERALETGRCSRAVTTTGISCWAVDDRYGYGVVASRVRREPPCLPGPFSLTALVLFSKVFWLCRLPSQRRRAYLRRELNGRAKLPFREFVTRS